MAELQTLENETAAGRQIVFDTAAALQTVTVIALQRFRTQLGCQADPGGRPAAIQVSDDQKAAAFQRTGLRKHGGPAVGQQKSIVTPAGNPIRVG